MTPFLLGMAFLFVLLNRIFVDLCVKLHKLSVEMPCFALYNDFVRPLGTQKTKGNEANR